MNNLKENFRSPDRSIIFRETFKSEYEVRKNGGIPNNTLFQNGKLTLTGSSSYVRCFIGRRLIISTISFRIIYKKKTSSLGYLFDLRGLGSGVGYLSDTSGTLTSGSGLKYINGVLTSSYTSTDFIEVVVTGITVFTYGRIEVVVGASNGYASSSNMEVKLFEIYNRSLSASEVSLLYKQQLYSEPQQLTKLLDFDSTGGQIVDLTGKNTLTATNVEIKQIGKVKSAYFNGSSSQIVIPNFVLPVISHTIRVIVKRETSNLYTRVFSTSSLEQDLLFYTGTIIRDYGASGGDVISYTSKNRYYYDILVFCTYNATSNKFRTVVYINGVLIYKGLIDNTPYSTLSNTLYIGGNSSFKWKGFIPKLQIFNGIPNNPQEFAAQIFNSQKGNYGL